jgi:hypothetical protein
MRCTTRSNTKHHTPIIPANHKSHTRFDWTLRRTQTPRIIDSPAKPTIEIERAQFDARTPSRRTHDEGRRPPRETGAQCPHDRLLGPMAPTAN